MDVGYINPKSLDLGRLSTAVLRIVFRLAEGVAGYVDGTFLMQLYFYLFCPLLMYMYYEDLFCSK